MRKDLLYHYTSTYHLSQILESNYLKLTEGNLSKEIENYKDVVWLTDMKEPNAFDLGLDGSPVDKTEIRITIARKNSFKYWKVWSRKNKIDKDWAKILEKDRKPNNWWISEKIITTEDFLLIENVITGEVLYEKQV